MNTNRRKFLQKILYSSGLVYGLSSLTFASTNSDSASTSSGDTSIDYKALVNVFLSGGNDGVNTIIPLGVNYAKYQRTRLLLAIDEKFILPLITKTSNSGGIAGMHPALGGFALKRGDSDYGSIDVNSPKGGLYKLYLEDKVAVLSNVGTLIEPTSKTTIEKKTAKLPNFLRAHNRQSRQWMTANYIDPIYAKGWGGRMMEKLNIKETLHHDFIATMMSVNGYNDWQRGEKSVAFGINPKGGSLYNKGKIGLEDARLEAFDAMLKSAVDDKSNPFIKHYGTLQSEMISQSNHLVSTVLKDLPLLNSEALFLEDFEKYDLSVELTSIPKPEIDISLKLLAIVKLIQARIEGRLNASHQTFFVDMGGFDTHGDQLLGHHTLLLHLSNAIYAFQRCMEEMGVSDKVTLFTGSDFGRSVTSNGRGSDHGWGGHHFVVGGAVKGGDIYGELPNVEFGSKDTHKEKYLIPTTATDQYGATLCRWFGATSHLDELFPNLHNFSKQDLGFMA